MNSTFPNTSEGSTFTVVQQNNKLKEPEQKLVCGDPFGQLFTKQRHYIFSDEVKAIHEIQHKKQKSLSEIEFEIITEKPSKEEIHHNQSNQYNNFSANNLHKKLDDSRLEKSLMMNQTQDKMNLSFDVDIPSINNLSNYKKKLDKSVEQEIMLKGSYIAEKGIDSDHDFLKAMQGVGNFFRFYGIIYPKMKRFFYTKTMLGKMRYLTNAVRHTINDIVDFQHNQDKKSCFMNFLYYLYYILERICLCLRLDKIPIFNPENKLKIIFNCLIVTYNCFYLYLRSLQIFFHADYGVYGHHFHTIAEIAWVLEMIIQMNTSMYHHNHFTKDRKVIMKIYLKEYFLFEVLPLIFDGRKSEYLLLNILYLLPLLLKIKEFYILQILDNHSIFFLLKLIMQMLLFGHVLACAFSLVSAYEVNFFDYVTPWQTRYEDHYKDWDTKYLQSIYWAFATMMNVQNMQPTSNLELVFTCSCMLISCVGFGYLISAIGGILNEINKEQKEYKKDLNILNQFMKRKNIEIGLMRRANIQLKKYYEQQRRVRYIQENETLLKLNEYMMKELLISSNFKIIKQYPFFLQLFTEQTLFKMCTKMQEKLYAPSQIIFDKSIQQQDDYYLYLIVSGQIFIEDQFNLQINVEKKEHNKYYFLDDNKQFNLKQKELFLKIFSINFEQIDEEDERENEEKIVGRKLHKGDFFGVTGFFTGRESMQKAISQDFSTVMIISKKDFEQILQEEKRDFEKYKEVSDKIKFKNDYSDLKAQCFSCLSRFHYTDQCTKVYLDKDPLFVVKGQIYSINQERSFKKRNRSKFNAIFQSLELMKHIYKVRIELDLDSSFNVFDDNSQSLNESVQLDQDNPEIPHHVQKSKTVINNIESRVQIEAIFDEKEYRTELNKPESKMDTLQRNQLDFNNQNLQNNDDEGIYFDIKSQNNNYDTEIKEKTNRQTSLRLNTTSISKQENQLRLLINGLQEMLSQINNKGGNIKRIQPNQIGSNLELIPKNGHSINKNPSNYDKPGKNNQFDEIIRTNSRKSVHRQTFKSSTQVHSKKEIEAPHNELQQDFFQKSKDPQNTPIIDGVFIWDTDKQQNYDYYFPNQNAEEIIKKYSSMQFKVNKNRKSKKSRFFIQKQLPVSSVRVKDKSYKLLVN